MRCMQSIVCNSSLGRYLYDRSIRWTFMLIPLFTSGTVNVPVFPDSTALLKVSSKGFTFCKSWNRPTSSQFLMKRVGVGVWSAVKCTSISFLFVSMFEIQSKDESFCHLPTKPPFLELFPRFNIISCFFLWIDNWSSFVKLCKISEKYLNNIFEQLYKFIFSFFFSQKDNLKIHRMVRQNKMFIIFNIMKLHIYHVATSWGASKNFFVVCHYQLLFMVHSSQTRYNKKTNSKGYVMQDDSPKSDISLNIFKWMIHVFAQCWPFYNF